MTKLEYKDAFLFVLFYIVFGVFVLLFGVFVLLWIDRVDKQTRKPIAQQTIQLPATIKFNNKTYKVIQTRGSAREDLDLNCGKTVEYVGLTDCENHTLKIDVGEPLKDVQETLVHELFHVVSDCKDADDPSYRNKNCKIVKRKPTTTLHQAIYDLSDGWEQLVKQNPDLVKYLQATN